MTFQVQPSARIVAQISGGTNTLSITGVNQETTPSNAQTQLNKFATIFGVEVTQTDMKLIRTHVATN